MRTRADALHLVTLLVEDDDDASAFFTGVPGFEVAVFEDIAGNRWDLLGAAAEPTAATDEPAEGVTIGPAIKERAGEIWTVKRAPA